MTIADWAWPFVQRHIALLTKGAVVFPGMNPWTASDKHRKACAAAGIADSDLRPDGLRETEGAASKIVNIELTAADLREIESAASRITVHGARYSAAQQARIDR